MRINQLVATSSGLSRRASDKAILDGRITINDKPAQLGQQVTDDDIVKLDNKILQREERLLIVLNKPTGYICSRKGQGGKTIYDLLPKKYHNLNPVGRLDKDSSGLLLLTNDGQLAQKLTHPKYQKEKIYEVSLDRPLNSIDRQRIEQGIKLEDGISHMNLVGSGKEWQIVMSEGRNRQIRRTFAALSYQVTKLHRIKFASYILGDLALGKTRPA